MWPIAVTYAALAAIAMVILFLGIQVVGWRSTKRIVTRRHQRLRLATGLLLIVLLGLVALGPPDNLFYLFLYWGVCTILLLSLVVLALLDVRETLVSYAERYVELTQNFLEEEKRNQ